MRRFLRKSRLLLSYDPPGDGRTKRKLRDDLSKSSRSSHHSTFTTYRIARRNASFLKKITRECSYAKRFIDSNFRENITLDTLAELTHLNKYYFAHTFTEIYGIAPMNYLAQKRIFTSQELLTSTDLNQAAIAKQCGFSSSSYFSQCFRKICGMTPTAYRKQFMRWQTTIT